MKTAKKATSRMRPATGLTALAARDVNEREIRQLVRRRPVEVRRAIRSFRNLTRGKRRELGPTVSYFVSLLVNALRQETGRVRAAKTKKIQKKVKKKAGT